MSLWGVWLVSGAAAACAMEPWAAWVHRDLWHGRLWGVHRTHHRGPRDIAPVADNGTAWRHRFELNDALALLHAPLAAFLIVYGCEGAPGLLREIGFGIGFGMTAFGVSYIVIHDGLAHGRLPVSALGSWRYLRRVQAAHMVHHRTGGPPYGLFWGPSVVVKAKAARRREPTRSAR